ncbi:MAG: S8 family serine peptidase [Chthonomonadales bacterium]|nr:S8 family serine peptidase [Chthonomonadales bacterium]
MNHRLIASLTVVCAALIACPAGAGAQGAARRPRPTGPVAFAPAPTPLPQPAPGRRGMPALRLGSVRPRVVPNQYVVKMKPSTPGATLRAVQASVGARVLSAIPKLGVQVIEVPNAAAGRALARNPNVLWAYPRAMRYPLVAPPNDPAYNQIDTQLAGDPDMATWFKWDAHDLGAVAGWSTWPGQYFTAAGKGSAAVTLAVIDTGIDYDHPDFVNAGGSSSDVAFGGQLLRSMDVSILSGVTTAEAWDVYGHGTHVAGIAAASTNNGIGSTGMGYNANVISIRVVDAEGNGTDDDLARAIVYAADHGALICNVSLGGYDYSQAEQDAVNYAWQKGMLVVAAAGNDASNLSPNYPGALSKVLAVSAVARQGYLATYSNWGNYVGISAPGGDWDFDVNWFLGIYSTTPTYFVTLNDPDAYGMQMNYDYLMGTSMASPQVAGLAALYAGMKGYSQATPGVSLLIYQALQRAADGGSTWSPYYGYGIINIHNTLNLDSDPNPRGATTGGVIGQVSLLGSTYQGATLVARRVGTTDRYNATAQSFGAYRFAGLPAGDYDITATALGQNQTIAGVQITAGCDRPGVDFNIGALATTTTVADLAASPGQGVTLSATLARTDNGDPVPNADVAFSVDGASAGTGVTNAAGVATVAYTVPGDASGVLEVTAAYAGGGAYLASSDTGQITVGALAATRAWIGDRTQTTGRNISFWGYLKRADTDAPIAGKTVHLLIEGASVASGTTGADGRALLTYYVPVGHAPGAFPARVEFHGDASFGASADDSTLNVQVATRPWVGNRTQKAGKTVYFWGYMQRTDNGQILPGLAVRLLVDGAQVDTGVTDGTGRALLSYAIPADKPLGAHPVVLQFDGSGGYLAASGSSTLTVTAP